MKSRLPDVPVLRTMEGSVGAATWSHVVRVLARLGAPHEMVLGNRGLHFHLERELWLCSDLRLNQIPLIAWSRFDSRRRAGLHAPVECRVFYYHAWGTVIELAVLNDLDRRLVTRLSEEERAGSSVPGPRVVAFQRPPGKR